MSGGPKYVKDFEFPSSFGFTGSAHDSPRISVRPHERRRFQEGGRVDKEPKKEEPKPPPKEPDKESTIGFLKGDARKKAEKELGLKKGGKVRKVGKPEKGETAAHERGESARMERKEHRMGEKAAHRKGYAKGGDVAQDRKMMDSTMKKHINTPAPKGHKGLKGC